MDTNELQEKYPFLNKVLSAYSEFDENLRNGDELYSFYETKVSFDQEKREKYKDISLKLLRNLRIFADNRYDASQAHEYCTYLYHWLYLNTKDYDDVDFLISIIFMNFQTERHPNKINMCPYNAYNEQKDVFKLNDLVKLSYYKFNQETIKDILKKREHDNYCLCQKYIEECVNTYRKMIDSHCSNTKKENNEKLHSELRQFDANYTYLTRDLTIREKIPEI